MLVGLCRFVFYLEDVLSSLKLFCQLTFLLFVLLLQLCSKKTQTEAECHLETQTSGVHFADFSGFVMFI